MNALQERPLFSPRQKGTPLDVLTQGRILIVDDELANVRFLEIVLKQAGYNNVYSTTDPTHILSFFTRFKPDVLLLDLHMPSCDGFAVMQQLQAHPEFNSVPILVLTADGTVRVRHKALTEGARDFLIKPLDETEVLLRINNLLETRFQNTLLEQKVQEAQRFLRSTFDALTSHVAVLDERGTIIATNKAWRAFAEENDGVETACDIGANYLEVCDRAAADGIPEATAAVQGIRQVMAQEVREFLLEYPCHSPDIQSWFVMRVTQFIGAGPVRVVIAHENITERKLAELAVIRLDKHILTQQKILTHYFMNRLEEDRRTVSYELHDGLTQYVMSSFAFLDSFAAKYCAEQGGIKSVMLEKGLKSLEEAVLEARRLVNGLRSLALDDLGLGGALEQLLQEERQRANWEQADFICDPELPRFDVTLETAVYRIVQEALTNIRKHAKTNRVQIGLKIKPEAGEKRLTVEIRDWGTGFSSAEKRQQYDHIGLHSMAERVNLLEGSFEIESQPGEGTRIYAEFPLT